MVVCTVHWKTAGLGGRSVGRGCQLKNGSPGSLADRDSKIFCKTAVFDGNLSNFADVASKPGSPYHLGFYEPS